MKILQKIRTNLCFISPIKNIFFCFCNLLNFFKIGPINKFYPQEIFEIFKIKFSLIISLTAPKYTILRLSFLIYFLLSLILLNISKFTPLGKIFFLSYF